MEELNAIKKDLQKSPLYKLSLTNKEIFHSNFIAWFGNEYSTHFIKLIKLLLNKDELNWTGKITIKREYKHFDIAVLDSSGKLCLVIENKIKSIPTQKQLDKYETEAKKLGDVEFVLLTMNEQCKEWTNKSSAIVWNVVDYHKLCTYLRKVSNSISNIYHKELLSDYCHYVSCLQKAIRIADSNKFCYNVQEYEILSSIGIHDVCGKRQVQAAHLQLIHAFNELELCGIITIVENTVDLESGKRQIQVNWTYTNAPVLEVRFKTCYNDFIIIQIQGGQYRHAIEYFDEKIGERIDRNEGEKVSYIPNERGLNYLKEKYPHVLFGKDAIKNYPKWNVDFGQREQFCKYCNGRTGTNGISCFVYQWVPIPENIEIKDLVEAIVKDTVNLLSLTN